MIRHLKALGLTLAAVLALGALTASGASAQELTSATSPVTLKAIQGTETNTLTSGGNKLHCANAFYTGHKVSSTPHAAIPTTATEITVTPHYETCNEATPAGTFRRQWT